MDSTSEGNKQGDDAGGLLFSSDGHVLGLADGVLFGARRPLRKPGPAAATRKAPPSGPDGESGQSPDGDATCG